MATQIQHRRGSTAQHATFTGAIGEITVDTSKKVAVVHDGSTAGGVPLARDDQKNDGSLGYAQEIKTDNYAVVASDAGKMLIANKATAITFTLGAAASLTSKFVAIFKNINAGALSIAPTGAELIDGANTAITVPTGTSVLIKGDGSSFRTYLSNGDVTGNAINTAPALTGANLADNDKLGVYDVSAGALVSVLISELIAGIFKTARTIANAQFAAATFKLFNAAGTPRALTFDATALTADRKIIMPDKDISLSSISRFAIIEDQRASGTAGGSVSNSSYTTRPLNTEVYDPEALVSISSDTFTATADCILSAACVFTGGGQNYVRLYNVTDSVVAAKSVTAISSTGTGSVALINARVVAGKTYRFEDKATSSGGSRGAAGSDGTNECYLTCTLKAVA